MPKIVLIEKSGVAKTLTVKDFTEETLYKKAGFKLSEGFSLQHTWGAEDGVDQSIKLYAKKNGRAGQENKYDFPPPVDSALFFGSCVLVGTDPKTGAVVDLESDDWEEIYEYLFGGFEDVGSDDSDGEGEEDVDTDDELDAIRKTTGEEIKQTKQGYAKDGFIVDDDETEEDAYESEESDESGDTPIPTPKKNAKKGRKPNASNKHANGSILSAGQLQNVAQDTDLKLEDCESELSEESYD
jgi:hypothetical protein